MRIDFPNLNHHPDETFRTLSWTELIRLDSKLESSGKSAKKLTEKLAKNLEKFKNNPKKIPEGSDNRSDILHEARFLGGHMCKNTEIWLQARKTIGLTGLEPVSRYDSEGVGLNSNINSHIWANLHNPGSKDISIKMLSPNGLKESRISNEKNGAGIKKDFESLGEIKQALATLRIANQFIYPWNFSFTTLEYFLMSVQFGEKEIGSIQNKISFVSEFIDEVIIHNADAWDDAKPFMEANEISNKWVSNIMLKFPKNQGKFENKQKFIPQSFQSNKQKPPINSTPPPPKQNRPWIPPFLCRRFNNNVCPNQADLSCLAPWDSSKTLAHQCAYQNPVDKKFCLLHHSIIDHK